MKNTKNKSLFFSLGLLFAGLLSLLSAPALTAPASDPVYVMTMEGAVSPAYAAFLEKAITQAHQGGGQMLLLEMNTPGGLLTSTREMVSAITESPLPVVIHVTPAGAHAASAGTFLMYAAHIAVMDEGTNIGAATPIEISGGGSGSGSGSGNEDKENAPAQTNGNALDNKALEDSSALIRSLADMRGRNAEWGVKAVREAASLTAREALEQGVIDHLSTSRTDLLQKIDGTEIALKNGRTVSLQTKDAPVHIIEADWKTKILALISDPNIAMILMTIGVYGILLEFYSPGTLLPGTIGVLALIAGLYAMNILPVNAAGIILLLVGAALLIAEFFVPSFGVLGIGGVAAFVIGGLVMFDDSQMPGLGLDWQILGGMAFSGLLLVALIVWMAVNSYKRRSQTGTEGLIGSTARIVSWTGTNGRVRIQGEVWQAYSEEPCTLKAGDFVTIAAWQDDLRLKIIHR